MANGNFIVQNGLQVGPLTIDAATGSINTTGTVSVSGLSVSEISKYDSSIKINDTGGGGSNVAITIDGTVEHTIDASGVNLQTGDGYSINGASVLSATTLGSGVINSSLTSLGVITALSATAAVATNFSAANLNATAGSIGTLVATTGLSTANAIVTNFSGTTGVVTNFSTGNARISGGYADNFAIGANTAATGKFSLLTITGNTASTSTIYTNGLYDSGNRVLSTTNGAGNLTISGTAVGLTATGPGAVTTGSASAIPVITTDAYGRISSITTAAVSSTLNIAGTSGTGTVSLTSQTLTVAAGTGITTSASGQTITVSIPQAVATSSTPTFAGLTINGTITATTLNAATIGNTSAAVIGATGRFDTSVTTATLNAATIGNASAALTGGTVNITGAGAVGTLVATNFSTGNAQITSCDTTTMDATTGVITNFSSGNTRISAGYADNFAIGGNTRSSGAFTTLAASGITQITNSTNNNGTAYTSGALQVTGGAGIGGHLYVQGNLYVSNIVATTSQMISVTDPLLYLTASDPATYNYEIGTYSHFGSGATYQHTGIIRDHNDGVWKVVGNVPEPAAGTITFTNATYDAVKAGSLVLANTTTSTNTTTGALVVGGGAGIAGAVYAGSLYDNGNRVLTSFSSSGVGNLSVSVSNPTSTTIALPATGPGAASVGSSTAIPVITTDAYGRVAATSTAAVVAPAGTLTGSTLASGVTASSLTSVGTITTGTWSGSFGAVSGANLTGLTAGNLSGTIPSAVLGNSTLYIGTTAIALNRASANQAITGILSVAMPGSTSGTVTLQPAATAGTTTITLPATTGTVITSGDTGTVTSTMIADGTIVNGDINASAAIAISKLAASTISGVSLGNNLNTLTMGVSGTGLSGSATYNGSGAATFTVTSNATNLNTASAIVARDASGNFSAGTITATISGSISGGTVSGTTLTSTVATGTAPLTVASTTLVTNLNADLWDGNHFSSYLNQAVLTSSAPTFAGLTTSAAIVPNANASINIGSTSAYFATVYGTAWHALYADLAENYRADKAYNPGTVVMFGGSEEVTLATTDTTAVAGVVSTAPATLMNGGLVGNNIVPLALQGRVPCQVIGPVKKGDMMVSAGWGYAKSSADPKMGQVIGKALEDFPLETKGIIEVVIGRL